MNRSLVPRGAHFAARTLRDAIRFGRDTLFGTTSPHVPGEVIHLMSPIPLSALLPHGEALLALAGLTLEHRFDLLGSGWMQLSPPASFRSNLSNSRQQAQLRASVDRNYTPIDWHCDFKSSHRWNQRTWHRHIRFGNKPGVDVKVPWELARMQHLPRLALAFGIQPDTRYSAEFRNQVLDFAAANPPRYGVNWVCAMDVAIRAVNWLVAYDLFRGSGAEFDPQFGVTFTRLISEHAHHVRCHLERRGNVRNNHYLAGISGLIFAARYLPPTSETRNWLRFATGELIREVRHQFHSDGSNFEGSTSYHCLSAEMVFFATSVLVGLPDPPELPAWYRERLERMAEFTRALETPEGKIPQIGDNDSGRFLHLTPMYRKVTTAEARSNYLHLLRYETQDGASDYWDQNDGDHSHLLDAAEALLNANAVTTLEGAVLRNLARGRCCPSSDHQPAPAILQATKIQPQGHPVEVCNIEIGNSPVSCRAFPDFGVYLFQNRDFFLSVRCGGARGTHAHHDHLSIELHHRGEVLFRDPGTFVYTPHPTLRRRYRSFAAHAVPYPVEEDPQAPVFRASEPGSSKCLAFTQDGFLGIGYFGAGRRAYRQIHIRTGTLQIKDFLNTTARFEAPETVPYSPGYGKLSAEWVRGGRTQKEQSAQCVS